MTEAVYIGEMTTTYGINDLTGAGATARMATMPVWVLIQRPYSMPTGGAETNPFHMEIGPGTAIPERPPGAPPVPGNPPPAPPTPPGTLPTPGEMFFASATLQPDQPPVYFTVVQSWTYTLDMDTAVFTGKMDKLLTIDVNNMVASSEIGGPLTPPGGTGEAPCLGGINNESTVDGQFVDDQIQVIVRGTAGGFLTGPTCLTEFPFQAEITAKIQPVGTAAAVKSVSDALRE